MIKQTPAAGNTSIELLRCPRKSARHSGGGLCLHAKRERVAAIFWWPGTVESAVVPDLGSTLDLVATC